MFDAISLLMQLFGVSVLGALLCVAIVYTLDDCKRKRERKKRYLKYRQEIERIADRLERTGLNLDELKEMLD